MNEPSISLPRNMKTNQYLHFKFTDQISSFRHDWMYVNRKIDLLQEQY